LGRPRFFPATLAGGQVQLNWGGAGRLEWAPAMTGPWTEVEGAPAPPFAVPIVAETARFFRLNSTP